MQYPEDFMICMMTLQSIEEMLRYAIGGQKLKISKLVEESHGVYYKPNTKHLLKRTFGQLANEFHELCDDQGLVDRLKGMVSIRNEFAHSLLTNDRWHEQSLKHQSDIIKLRDDLTIYIDSRIFPKPK